MYHITPLAFGTILNLHETENNGWHDNHEANPTPVTDTVVLQWRNSEIQELCIMSTRINHTAEGDIRNNLVDGNKL